MSNHMQRIRKCENALTTVGADPQGQLKGTGVLCGLVCAILAAALRLRLGTRGIGHRTCRVPAGLDRRADETTPALPLLPLLQTALQLLPPPRLFFLRLAPRLASVGLMSLSAATDLAGGRLLSPCRAGVVSRPRRRGALPLLLPPPLPLLLAGPELASLRMSEVSLHAESEAITTDLQMDYEEDRKTEESLRSDLDDDNDDNYESVDLDKDHCHVDGGFEEVDQRLETDVQGVGKACSDTDVELNSGDAVITKGSADDGERHGTNLHTNTSETPGANGETCPQTQETTMAEDSHRSSAAEITITSNGDMDQNSEKVPNRDSSLSPASGLNLSEPYVPSSNYTSTTEGIIESGPHRGSASLPTSPVTPVAASMAVGGRLARSASDSQPETGQQRSGAMVLSDDLKNPAMEKLDLVRKWSINTYKCTRQILSEKLGRGSKTVDLELESQIEVLRDNKRRYEHVVKLAQTLSGQLAQMMHTQKQLGDAFADLSLKSPELHEEFGYNAETQRLLSKNAETLLSAINFFIASVNTLVDKTIEDTMINIKQYEAARIEYDAYRTDLEELNLGPRDATTMPKIEVSQRQFQAHREKYERMRNDVSVKLKFLEENKVKVLHNQLILFHNAIAAYYAGNQQQLEQTLKQFHIKLKMPGGDTPSWLEQN
ncbi:Arfaptin-1 [Merluccius polli]|uniref:Arfaptin-1 n=1 Tax=Merluccius polli TaxID=89951 RepID=A0AA47P3T2_MERPO|nr:Arfaptin-1 [Merluccius polli]